VEQSQRDWNSPARVAALMKTGRPIGLPMEMGKRHILDAADPFRDRSCDPKVLNVRATPVAEGEIVFMSRKGDWICRM
jgi:hypothetical protein